MTEPFTLQVTVDCASPHVLADWWAETLCWEVEPQDEAFIRSMIEKGLANEADTMLHNDRLVWASAAAIRPEQATGAGQPRLLFQQVPEAKSAKNRIHFDVRAPAGAALSELHERLLDRGATKIGQGEQGPHQWFVFADPEGNEFCVDR